MLASTEIIVLLLLPVAVFVITPLLLFSGWLTVRGIMFLLFPPKLTFDQNAKEYSGDGMQPCGD